MYLAAKKLGLHQLADKPTTAITLVCIRILRNVSISSVIKITHPDSLVTTTDHSAIVGASQFDYCAMNYFLAFNKSADSIPE
jgi:hypothetical protein